MQFDVRIPKKDDPAQIQVVVVEARDSLSALRHGLEQLNDSIDMSAMVCDFSDPDCLRVTDPASDRTIVIGEHDPNAAPEEPAVEEATPTPEPETASVTTQPTEDLVAIADQPETREMTAPEHSGGTEESDVIGEVSIPQEEVPLNNDMGKTELYIPTFAVEQALAQAQAEAAAQAEAQAPSYTANLPMREESVDTDGIEIGEAVMYNTSNNVPMDATMVEAVAVPDSQASLPAAMPEPVKPTEPISVEPAQPTGQNTLSIRALTGSEGQYKPGMTTETLANVFMRAMDIYDYDDRNAAMKFVLELGMSDVTALGGGVLLTDINSPEQVLWFEATAGPNADVLQNFRIPLGQGVVGYCAQQAVSQNVADVSHEPRFQEDVLSQAGLAISSLLCVPITHQKRVYGAVVFFNPPGMRPFTQGEVSILSYLAHVAGEYLGQQ